MDETIRTDGVHTGYFLAVRRQFKLPVFGELKILQDLHDMGPAHMEQLFRNNIHKTDLLIDVIKFGLIGGGMDEAEADELVRSAIKAGRILKYTLLAHTIILVTLGPDETEEEEIAKKKLAEEAAKAEPEHSESSASFLTETSSAD